MKLDPAQVPVFVLCGGLGTRLKEETELRPKPMVPIGNRPILWHIMNTYAWYGFKRFVLCLGYKAEVIKSYFLHYSSMNADFSIDLRTNQLTTYASSHGQDWHVTLAYTGETAMTGARVARAAERFLGDAESFAVTYGDGLTDADLRSELAFHHSHGRIGTVLGTSPPSRFGKLVLEGNQVTRFDEKPMLSGDWINGGYFFFRREFLRYLSEEDSCVLERAPLVRLADDRELEIYKHHGFWTCMDTQRDQEQLNAMWASGQARWAAWAQNGSKPARESEAAEPAASLI